MTARPPTLAEIKAEHAKRNAQLESIDIDPSLLWREYWDGDDTAWSLVEHNHRAQLISWLERAVPLLHVVGCDPVDRAGCEREAVALLAEINGTQETKP